VLLSGSLANYARFRTIPAESRLPHKAKAMAPSEARATTPSHGAKNPSLLAGTMILPTGIGSQASPTWPR